MKKERFDIIKFKKIAFEKQQKRIMAMQEKYMKRAEKKAKKIANKAIHFFKHAPDLDFTFVIEPFKRYVWDNSNYVVKNNLIINYSILLDGCDESEIITAIKEWGFIVKEKDRQFHCYEISLS